MAVEEAASASIKFMGRGIFFSRVGVAFYREETFVTSLVGQGARNVMNNFYSCTAIDSAI